MEKYIKKAELLKTVFEIDQFPVADYNCDFLLFGKSNVGKSSFINTITQRKRLAYTSGTPGKTQSINFYKINDLFCIVDLPGYGFGKVSYLDQKKWTKLLEYYFTRYNTHKYAFILIDIRREPDEKDLGIINYLAQYNIPVYFIITKSDKIGKSKFPSYHSKFTKIFATAPESVILFSSLKKTGMDKVENLLKTLNTDKEQ